MTLVIGIDPGNVSSGISYWYDGSLVGHETFEPWVTSEPNWDHSKVSEGVCVFVEVAAHGAKATREGIQWAGGMVVRALMEDGYQVTRPKTWKLKPHAWRDLILKGVPANPKGWSKAECLEEAERWKLYDYESEDEAEAVLIGAAGCLMRGIEPQGRK